MTPRQILEAVESVFPTPIGDNFQGRHHLFLRGDGRLGLILWYLDKVADQTAYRPIIFDDPADEHDADGFNAFLLQLKQVIDLENSTVEREP